MAEATEGFNLSGRDDAFVSDRQAQLSGVEAAAKPLTFWSAVGAVIVGNLALGILVALVYGVLHVWGII